MSKLKTKGGRKASPMPADLGPSGIGTPAWLAYHGERVINDAARAGVPGANMLSELGKPAFDARRAAISQPAPATTFRSEPRRRTDTDPKLKKGSRPLTAAELAKLHRY